MEKQTFYLLMWKTKEEEGFGSKNGNLQRGFSHDRFVSYTSKSVKQAVRYIHLVLKGEAWGGSIYSCQHELTPLNLPIGSWKIITSLGKHQGLNLRVEHHNLEFCTCRNNNQTEIEKKLEKKTK